MTVLSETEHVGKVAALAQQSPAAFESKREAKVKPSFKPKPTASSTTAGPQLQVHSSSSTVAARTQRLLADCSSWPFSDSRRGTFPDGSG